MTEPQQRPPAAPGQGADPLAGLIRALDGLGLRPDSRELAGALWLALRIDRVTPGWSTLHADGAPPPGDHKPGPADRDDPPPASAADTDHCQGADTRGGDAPGRAAQTPAFPLTARAAAGAIAASAVRVPDRTSLPQALHLGRAWRMLRRRRPSRREQELDLEATVERLAEQHLSGQGLWGLVYRARAVPWLDLTLVIDRGPAMAVWGPLIDDLTALLCRTRVFATVRIRYLESATAGPRLLEAERPVPAASLGKPLPGAAPGHMLTLVLSDGVSRAWYDPATYRILHRLGRDGLAVLVQLLPANRWIDTALGAGEQVRLGVVQTRDPKLPLIAPVTAHGGAAAGAGDTGVLPVISQTPWGVRALVGMLRGGGAPTGLIGYRLAGPGVALADASPYATDPPPAQRLERFLSVASPAARRLAGYLSRLPYPLTVRMMLLVQQAMQPGEDLGALAEVFSGGLLELHRPAGPGTPASYRIVGQGIDRPDPGPVVRALANLVSRAEAWTVLCTLTGELQRAGQHPAADWPLLIADAAAGAPFRLPAGLTGGDAWERALALIAVDVARRRGGAWLRGGERLAAALAVPPPAPPPRVPDPVQAPPPPTAPTPFRDPFRDGAGAGPAMVWLPGGTFRMGGPAGVGADDERPVHEVRLSHYAVGKYQVTVGEFRRFVAATGYRTEAERGDGAFVRDQGRWDTRKDANWQNPYFRQGDDHPVVCISWNDARAYCDWLGRETGQTYGLLTEAQWEHACRAGSEALYCFGDDAQRLDDYAWYADNAGAGTHPLGEKGANAWGLHDLHGNVWEWCEDWYASDYSARPQSDPVGSAVRTESPAHIVGLSASGGPHSGPYGDSQSTTRAANGTAASASSAAVAASGGEQRPAEDPSGPESGSDRVVRGGAWNYPADNCRSAYRNMHAPSNRNSYLGFRLSRTGPLHSYPWFPCSAWESGPRAPEPIPNLRDPLPDGTQGPAMVWLPGGTFTMGQDDSSQGDEKPAHPVHLGAFSIGQYQVTFAEYDRFCAATGREQPADQGWGRDRRPAINVSWDDAQAYCAWLSKETGEGYRLATEAEWEYACRAGSTTRWSCGNEESRLGDYAWYSENGGGKTHPVGEKRPNAWHLHDLHGNVWEWCRDWYSDSHYQQAVSDPVGSAVRTESPAHIAGLGASGGPHSGPYGGSQSTDRAASGTAASTSSAAVAASGGEQRPAEDPSGPESGSLRVVRGGAWDYTAGNCRSAYRHMVAPSSRYSDLGFRLSRTGPWPSYPITLVGAQAPRVPEPSAPVVKPRFAPYEVFRDPLEGADQDGATATPAAPEMVYLPGGTFQMGDAQGGSDEQPVHPVSVSAFALGRTPVTCGDYLRFCEATDTHWPEWLEAGSQYHLETGRNDFYAKRGIGREALDLPVVGIGWEDARAYCDWLSQQTGERYALPTEAQWEYAGRAGFSTRWCCGDDAVGLGDYAWFSDNAAGRLHPVGQKLANAWGLYDMHGNVWEWCADWYAVGYYQQLTDRLAAAASGPAPAASGDQQPASGWRRIATALGFGGSEVAVASGRNREGASSAAAGASGNLAAASGTQQRASENPSGPESGSGRVVRGGAWGYAADYCRSACRYRFAPSLRYCSLGFRLSRTV